MLTHRERLTRLYNQLLEQKLQISRLFRRLPKLDYNGVGFGVGAGDDSLTGTFTTNTNTTTAEHTDCKRVFIDCSNDNRWSVSWTGALSAMSSSHPDYSRVPDLLKGSGSLTLSLSDIYVGTCRSTIEVYWSVGSNISGVVGSAEGYGRSELCNDNDLTRNESMTKVFPGSSGQFDIGLRVGVTKNVPLAGIDRKLSMFVEIVADPVSFFAKWQESGTYTNTPLSVGQSIAIQSPYTHPNMNSVPITVTRLS